jgi:hypothetical protein
LLFPGFTTALLHVCSPEELPALLFPGFTTALLHIYMCSPEELPSLEEATDLRPTVVLVKQVNRGNKQVDGHATRIGRHAE